MKLTVDIKRFFHRPDEDSRRKNVLANAVIAVKNHLLYTNNEVYPIIFGVFLAAAAFIRFWAAPLSAGVDVPQFWAFAKVFELHGLDFYRYADAQLDIFPVKGWGYFYPPIWLLILRVALATTPATVAAETMVDSSWRLAEKAPIIVSDLAIGCLLYRAVPGSKLKKLFFATLWLFHPTAWYESAVFGQFDAIGAVLLLASVIMLEKGNDKIAFLIAGLAVMTKQHVLMPVAMMTAVSLRNLGWRRVLKDLSIFAGVVAAFSIPFLITGNFVTYVKSIILPGGGPDYQIPIMYAFSGSGSLLTYLHEYLGWNTKPYFVYTIPILVIGFLAALVFSYRRKITPAQGALIGFLVFIGLSYRANYQYLIVYIPLALLVASQTKFISERIITTVMALLPAVWLWLFNVSFWFYYIKPESLEAIPIMARIGLTHNDVPDLAYVILAMVLMCLFLAYVILAFTRWRKRPDVLSLQCTDNSIREKSGNGGEQ